MTLDIALTASLVSPIVPAEANGPHAVIVDLARGLAARGHRTTIYAAAGSRVSHARVVQIDVSPDAARAQVRPGSATPSGSQPDLGADFRRMFDAVRAGGHDVLSQHAFDAPAIGARPGVPVLHTLHLPPIVAEVVVAARDADAPLAMVSAASRADWQRVGVRAAWVLRNGVPDRGYRTPPPEPAALVCGRISPEKGTAVAIRVARAAGLIPWIAGDVYDEAYFEAEVRPLLNGAEWFGAVERARLADLMGCAAVLIMPIAWEEPFGLVAAEAQVAGCPVVAYRRGALPEVVQDGASGVLAEPDDEVDLTDAVSAALSLDRAAVRASALARLGVERMVGDYEAALTAVASGRPAFSPAA
jgi:glycosyltransferase involved in cell wall biosynthesis